MLVQSAPALDGIGGVAINYSSIVPARAIRRINGLPGESADHSPTITPMGGLLCSAHHLGRSIRRVTERLWIARSGTARFLPCV